MDTSKTRSEYTFVIEPHFILIIPKCENNEGPRLESSVELNALPRISQTLATPMTYTKPVREHVPGMSHGVDLTTSEDEADHAKGESRASELSLTINRTHQKPARTTETQQTLTTPKETQQKPRKNLARKSAQVI